MSSPKAQAQEKKTIINWLSSAQKASPLLSEEGSPSPIFTTFRHTGAKLAVVGLEISPREASAHLVGFVQGDRVAKRFTLDYFSADELLTVAAAVQRTHRLQQNV